MHDVIWILWNRVFGKSLASWLHGYRNEQSCCRLRTYNYYHYLSDAQLLFVSALYFFMLAFKEHTVFIITRLSYIDYHTSMIIVSRVFRHHVLRYLMCVCCIIYATYYQLILISINVSGVLVRHARLFRSQWWLMIPRCHFIIHGIVFSRNIGKDWYADRAI